MRVDIYQQHQRALVDEYMSGRGYLRRQRWTDVATASATKFKNAQATSDTVPTVITTFLAQPDFPRNVVITTGGTTADVAGGTVVVEGTNIRGEAISENFAITENQSGATTGNKAFKTITKVTIPAQDGAAATYSVGDGTKLGLDRTLNGAGEFLALTMDGAAETVSANAASATAVESNTVTPTNAPNNSRDYVAIFVSTEKTGKVGSTA